MLELIIQLDKLLWVMFSPLARIAVWACISGIVSMFLYALFSPQKKLSQLKEHQRSARKQLLAYDGDFQGMVALIKKDLGLASRQIGIIFIPFSLSIVPVLAILFCLYTIYGYNLPAPHTPTTLQSEPEAAFLYWQGNDTPQRTETGWKVNWPTADQPLIMKDQNGNQVLKLPLIAAIPEVTKQTWLTILFPNPAGSIAENSAIETVYINIPNKHYIDFGPDWMRGFAFWYFTILLVVSLFIKIRFRII